MSRRGTGASGPFRLFEHAPRDPSGQRDPLFVLFPTVGEIHTGPPIEEVHFIRDESADLVCAIEQTAPGKPGVPVDRNADAMAHFTALTPTPNDGATLPTRRYVLRTDVEQNWFPFLLPDDSSGTDMLLATVPPLDATSPPPLPWGRILAPFAVTPLVGMPQEEVTRRRPGHAGVAVCPLDRRPPAVMGGQESAPWPRPRRERIQLRPAI